MNARTRQVYFWSKWGGESERIVNEIDAALKATGTTSVRDKPDSFLLDRERPIDRRRVQSFTGDTIRADPERL